MLSDIIKKMNTSLNDVVHYTFNINDKSHLMNDLIGKKIKIKWRGQVLCQCGKVMKKFYRSSFCYNCFWSSPLASQSIFKPELCTAHLNIEERDLEWEKKFQIAPHYVYLANSSGIKVGITRSTQGVIRWMDQGASQAIVLAEVPNRRFSGDIEVSIKTYVSDKTNWRKMLSGEPIAIDLVKIKSELSQYVPDDLKKYILPDNTVTDIRYPVLEYPFKVKSLKLEKTNSIEGVLKGIKGQYLLMDNNQVFNVRAHEGFVADFSFEETLSQGSLF
jgi:hypothetical protein|tara:strand:+ start:4787 stop:5608 length:822 start_codon:yes stop_codon:yes gene_type:complete